jgi:UDP-N-acetylmuramyl pentapeptide phosphotransferase/UDP-N-acetylglucosamine-1-phosphate transferase
VADALLCRPFTLPCGQPVRHEAMIALVTIAAALIAAALLVALQPLLLRYALARPNARSTHRTPTPQGGGIGVVAATLLVLAIAFLWWRPTAPSEIVQLGVAVLFLAIVGGVDDLRPLPAAARLILQTTAVAAVVAASAEARLLPDGVPRGVEWVLVVIAGVWFVNLVNFMDGIDWLTVAEMVPITAFFALIGAAGFIPLPTALIGAALFGALLGFAPYNKPVAKLFLGDVGSLPIGLLVGWLLFELAGRGAAAAAILLPLYYLADATVTLIRRLLRVERVWEAHRQHFYQQAIDRNGFSVREVVRDVFVVNVVLAALGFCTIVWPAWPVQLGALVIGCGLVVTLLRRFATRRPVGALA